MDSKRQLQIGELIKRHFAPVLQEHGPYIYGNAFVTVTLVKVTPDLSQAKVYVSIYNAEDKAAVLNRISGHTHILKQALAGRIRNQIRRMPQIFFYYDETIDEMYKVDGMFENLKTIYPPSVQEEE
jgi:ribosome-binding factor A